MMKRRNRISKYQVTDDGKITNTRPVHSARTKQIMELLTFAQMVEAFNSVEEAVEEVVEDGDSTEAEDIHPEV